MRKIIIILGLLIVQLSAKAQDISSFFEQTNDFMKTYVADGKVAYEALHKDSTVLNALMSNAATIKIEPSDVTNYQAFWINAYNLAVIKGIVDHYPINSPLSKSGFFDKTTYALGGKNITLNDIENKLLRAQFKDARVHFVLVCGALGCPQIIDQAYLPQTLEAQLERQTMLALNDPNFVRVDEKKKRVSFSEIMKWYHEDFTRGEQSLIDFANQYRSHSISNNYKSDYYSYNWSLNKQ